MLGKSPTGEGSYLLRCSLLRLPFEEPCLLLDCPMSKLKNGYPRSARVTLWLLVSTPPPVSPYRETRPALENSRLYLRQKASSTEGLKSKPRTILHTCLLLRQSTSTASGTSSPSLPWKAARCIPASLESLWTPANSDRSTGSAT